ncbi:hypothetical protein INR49_023742 [Caranx melampygus]|nr:hypothetical protein INR49_023742 [Caranx melampygus]
MELMPTYLPSHHHSAGIGFLLGSRTTSVFGDINTYMLSVLTKRRRDLTKRSSLKPPQEDPQLV